MYDLPPPEEDGLYIEDVGEWSAHKHYFLQRYIDAFTTSMKDKPWSGLYYIDLFAGPGIVRLETSGGLEWGSPLIAMLAPNPFDGCFCCDIVPRNCDVLRARVERFCPNVKTKILAGDANEQVHDILAEIPPKSLSLAFLDPFGLHLDFATVEALSRKRADLIIFFPDHLDALRNWEFVYRDKQDSNLDRVLGPGVGWRAVLDKTPKSKWAEALKQIYVRQLRTLGFEHFGERRVCAKGRPLYLLIFCSRHKVAADLWRKTGLKGPDDQRFFDFGASP